ncbi:MAG: transporter [Bacillus sp. (in: firmicutes)]|uniref:metal ABC transporter ATP-binding protein n=1 Tax=Bacillus sp. 1NLA3E TaxID=666686 RepID=UPI000247EEEB|nr:metal ABC transporter ATP-binding protein [Bacillus sp. 1NLA3E]AGK54942.1 ABC transporter [Bacillus sp. 1NLA3E]MDF2903676.1 transporter [Bacillus sp. (in: firmicutes)]
MNQIEPIIQIQHVSYRYEKENVLEDINLLIHKGDFLGIVGPNGSGKSTLLKLILGLIKPQTGNILLFGQEIQRFRDWQKIGYVSQKANAFNTGFPATIFEVVASGLTKKLGLFRYLTKEDHEKVVKAIQIVGMESFIKHNIGELSGGQQQRVFIARALVSEPELLILDEPTVGVDAKNVYSFYQLLEDLNKQQGITLLLVTHDIGTITDKVTHVACLNNNLHFHGKTREFEELKLGDMTEFYGHAVQVLSHHHMDIGGTNG